MPDPAYRYEPFLRVLLFDRAGAGDGQASDDAPVAACQLVERAIRVDGAAHRIAGLARVAVEEARRGRRYGTRVVGAALAEARLRGYGYGVLFCRRSRQPFYGALGWRVLEGAVTRTIHGEEQPPREGGIAMALPLTPEADAEWPRWRQARIHAGIGGW
jgi:predicted N-acetyltransferase YhbS